MLKQIHIYLFLIIPCLATGQEIGICDLSVSGSSNLFEFLLTIEDSSQDEISVLCIDSVLQFSIPTEIIKSSNPIVDHKILQLINSDKHPEIIINTNISYVDTLLFSPCEYITIPAMVYLNGFWNQNYISACKSNDKENTYICKVVLFLNDYNIKTNSKRSLVKVKERIEVFFLLGLA
jgi:hypothetical protein